jgi:hypothetical protein
MMLYGAFGILVNHIIAYGILLFVWSTVFLSRMYLKEKSLKRKEGYEK